MAFCSECGAALLTQAKFCSKCGASSAQPGGTIEPSASRDPQPQTQANFAQSTSASPTASSDPLAAFVGPKADTYRRKWGHFEIDGSKKTGWNWASFFFNIYWLAYRRMWSYAAVGLCVSLVIGLTIVAANISAVWSLVFGLVLMLVIGTYGDYWYRNRYLSILSQVRSKTDPDGTSLSAIERLKKAGGTRGWSILGLFVLQYALSIAPAVLMPHEYLRWRGKLQDQLQEVGPGPSAPDASASAPPSASDTTVANTPDSSNGQADGATQDNASDKRTDISAMLPLAKQGDPDAENNVGSIYLNGIGVEKSASKAAYWYRKAAAQHQATAEVSLALMYVQGIGVTEDASKALPLLEDAAKQGDANAANDIGMMYQNGVGVDQDRNMAEQWFNAAIKGGSKEASENLAKLQNSQSSSGDSQDSKQAGQGDQSDQSDQNVQPAASQPDPQNSDASQGGQGN